ncbi:MAG TPA: MFS transporter [Pyrinomonadaceae bacterium]|jgi:MFS family permease|nr:MFS transporter [Pyrinomonadaceae bacterium]
MSIPTTPESPDDTPRTPSLPAQVPRYSFYALGVLSLVNFLNYIDRQILPAVAPVMFKDPDLKLTDAELGYMEAALLLSFTVLAPIFGRLGDRYPRARIMACAAVIWSIATALTGFVDQLPFLPASVNLRLPLVNATIMLSGAALALCFVRSLVGVGESAYSTITPSLIADYFPPHKRATALGVFQAAIPMGFALGFVIGGVLAHFFGWRIAFMIVGVPGLLTAILVWRLKEPMRGATDLHAPATAFAEMTESAAGTSKALAEDVQAESSWRAAWRILRTRDWLLSTIGYTALTSALGAFATWATVLLVRDKGMNETAAAITLGIVILLAGAMGTFGGGWIADRVIALRKNAYFLVCAVSTLLAILPTVVGLVADDARIFLPAIFISVTLLFISNAPFHAILLESVPTHVRAMAVALNIVVIHTFGDAISRAAVGLLSDSLKSGNFAALSTLAAALGIDANRQHLSTALLFAPAALLVSTLFFFWGAKSRKKTMDADGR